MMAADCFPAKDCQSTSSSVTNSERADECKGHLDHVADRRKSDLVVKCLGV